MGRGDVHGRTGNYGWQWHPADNNFVQACDLYRLLNAEEKERLIANIAGTLALVSRDDIIERSINHFSQADPEYGRRVASAVRQRRAQHKTEATAPAHTGVN